MAYSLWKPQIPNLRKKLEYFMKSKKKKKMLALLKV